MDNLKSINKAEFNEAKLGTVASIGRDAKIAELSKIFKVDAATIEKAILKTPAEFEKQLKNAIQTDFKGGFRGSSSGALGNSAKLISKEKAIKEIFDAKTALKEEDIIRIIDRIKSESKLKAANAEAKLLGKEVESGAAAEKTTASGKKKKYNKKGNKKPSTFSKITTAIGEKLRGMVTGKWTWGRIVAWCAVLGISAAAVWWYFYSQDGPVPEDMPQNEPNDEIWGPCLTYLIKNQGAKIGTLNTGATVVTTVPNAEYPGGIQFYSNGRVFNLKTKDKGSWKCIGGAVKTQTNENMNKPKLNESIGQIVKRVLNERYLMEQSDAEIDKDVNKMIDFLDWPVNQKNLQDAYNLLVRYSTSPKVKDFLHYYEKSGLANTSLSTSLSTIYAIEPGSVRLKEKLIALLDQIESGTVKPIAQTSNTNTNTGGGSGFKMTTLKEQELQISWDKDKKTGGDGGNGGGNSGGGGGGNSGGGGGGGTTRKSYYDCSGVNIETTPLTYGCKDQKIAQIQACLGLSSDGKFGPNTLKALKDNAYDTKNGITKAIYDKVMEGCKKGSVAQTATSTEGGADVKYLRTPIKMDLGPVPQMPAKNTSASGAPSSEGMTDTAYYNSLVQNGLFNATGILGRTAYNGPALEPSELQKVNNVLTSMGYVQDRVKATDGGAKYIWQKQ